jgi:hypothetical protein
MGGLADRGPVDTVDTVADDSPDARLRRRGYLTGWPRAITAVSAD